MTAFYLAVLAALASTASAFEVKFDRSLIHAFTVSLPVFKLSPPITLPTAYLQSTLNSVAPSIPLQASNGAIATNGSQIVAFIQNSGFTAFFPQYESIVPSVSISTAAAASHFKNPSLFPKDDTIIEQAKGPTLMTATHRNDGTTSSSTEAQPLLEHVIAQRSVPFNTGSIPIRGSGSKAVFGFGSTGLKSLSYYWHSATRFDKVAPASVQTIADAIVAQLKTASKIAPYTVESVEAWYCDSGKAFIQPCFYFTASRDVDTALPKGTPEIPVKISGYVPAGVKSFEPLPEMPGSASGAAIEASPMPPPPEGQAPPVVAREEKEGMVARALGKRVVLPTITVGRYVVRQDDAGWTASANNFWKSLSALSGKYMNAVSSQYYLAYPYLFTTNKQLYINSVHVALTEVHGNWKLFSTLKNNADFVYLSQIPATGYGPAAGGKLCYWIIHACEVIPAVVDYPQAPATSYDVWWKIFNGLHAVVGYRTEMYINDGVTTNFGTYIGQGVPVVSAWMQAVHNDFYWYGSTSKFTQTYYDANVGKVQPFGRASSVYVCGHVGDVVWNVANIGKATCLQETYYAN